MLRRPELDWAPSKSALDRREVESRLGAIDAPLRLLSGGLMNTNVLVGEDRVVRIYRDPSALGREAALLRQRWSSFVVPPLLEVGADFLLLGYVAHDPLEDSAMHGAWVGRALAEIHARPYPTFGLLADDLSISRGFSSSVVHGYAAAEAQNAAIALGDPALADRVLEILDANAATIAEAQGKPVLVHGDWKPVNLHATGAGLLVLDWEFAWAGLRLMDVGQLLRWDPGPAFADAFADAYRAHGGTLVDDWQCCAALFDLCALLGLLGKSASDPRRTTDVVARIEQTLAQFA